MTKIPDPEREQFAATFLALGPQAPTILPGWDASDLLEHLLLREKYPHLMLGPKLPGALGRRAESARRALQETPWEQLVEIVREGPSRLSPIRAMDTVTGQGELLIHHEDLRRAQDDWEPRDLSPAEGAQAWRALSLLSRLTLRVRAEITLISPLGGLQRRARGALGSLRVHGEPLELLLWASGRDEVARVQIHGDDSALRALREGRRGM